MVSRRAFLIGSAGGVMGYAWRATSGFAKGSQPSTPVRFSMPHGACDCHVHVFGDLKRFPFWSGRPYTPGPASLSELRALHRVLHLDRVVVSQPSAYGTDTSCLLDAVRQLGSRARGVAGIEENTAQSQLDELDRAGIRGLRIGFEGKMDTAEARRRFQIAVEQIGSRKWNVQIGTRLPILEALQNDLMASPVPIVFEHFAHAEASLGLSQPGFGALLNLVRTGKAYVKISAAYRSSTRQPDYPDIEPLVKALISANPQRVIWGTDWPHPGVTPPGHPVTDIAPPFPADDGKLLNLFAAWAPDPSLRKTILVENPARLYGFA